ncbi:DUF4139 domain-containing protein [bacterium]|nr:DUF4139 domain-containing protein [bacterium]
MRSLILATVIAFSAAGSALAGQAGEVEAVSLTVYNSDLALIREERSLQLDAGTQLVVLDNVSGQLRPETVHLDTNGGNVAVLEQNFDYDLVSRDKLLQRFIGKTITLRDDYSKTEMTGRLLSVSSGIILEVDGQVLLDPPGRIILPSGAADQLLLRPTLSWQLASAAPLSTRATVSYLSGGLSWNADYVMVLSADDSRGSLEGWVTLSNYSGTTYDNASLKLVAGEVNRVRDEMDYAMKAGAAAPMAEASMADGFQEESLFEYHLYDLQRQTTIRNNQQKQIGLLSASDFPVKKVMVFDGMNGGDVKVNVEFNNGEENGLGMPLPAGTMRVMKADSEGELQFIGENNIKHTPRKEDIRLFIGNAFDVKGEVTQTEYKDLGNGYTASYKVKLKNRKEKEAVSVTVPVVVYGEWKITASNHDPIDKDAWTKEFMVNLPPDSEKELTYSIQVTWK